MGDKLFKPEARQCESCNHLFMTYETIVGEVSKICVKCAFGRLAKVISDYTGAMADDELAKKGGKW